MTGTKPLQVHTVWLDIAISAIMSLAPDRERRLYCVIDELPTLQKLPSLSDFLARARKYGGCGILGFQSYPQLEATYGIQDAAAITGYCSTWVALRANDTPTAKHVSENLGQVEQIEANEGMSYGVNDMRDGVNLSRLQVTRPLVMHTEVTNLPNLSGFLRFGRNLPVVRFADSYNDVPDVVPAFIERQTPPLRLPQGQTIIARAKDEADARDAVEQSPPRKPATGKPKEQEPDLFSIQSTPSDQQGPGPGQEEVSQDKAGNIGDNGAPPSGIDDLLLGPAQGDMRIPLQSHARRAGPREAAKPA